MSTVRQAIKTVWSLTFARYVIVGTANTAFGYLVYAAALVAGASYPVASLISLAAGIVVSFTTQGTYVFRNPNKALFFQYALVWGVVYLGNVGVISLFVHSGISALIAGALALPFNVLLGFFLQRYFVFGKADRQHN